MCFLFGVSAGSLVLERIGGTQLLVADAPTFADRIRFYTALSQLKVAPSWGYFSG